MTGRSAALIAGSAVAALMVVSTPATAKPIEKGKFTDTIDSGVYDATAPRPRTPVRLRNFTFRATCAAPPRSPTSASTSAAP